MKRTFRVFRRATGEVVGARFATYHEAVVAMFRIAKAAGLTAAAFAVAVEGA